MWRLGGLEMFCRLRSIWMPSAISATLTEFFLIYSEAVSVYFTNLNDFALLSFGDMIDYWRWNKPCPGFMTVLIPRCYLEINAELM